MPYYLLEFGRALQNRNITNYGFSPVKAVYRRGLVAPSKWLTSQDSRCLHHPEPSFQGNPQGTLPQKPAPLQSALAVAISQNGRLSQAQNRISY